MENAEPHNLPDMPLSAASLVIATTPKRKATLTGITCSAEHLQRVDMHHPHFLQQVRDFIDPNIYLSIEPEGPVARVQVNELELPDESQEIIRQCTDISLDVRRDIDRTASEIFDVERELPLPYNSSLAKLYRTLRALEQRRNILHDAKKQIIYAESMRINGLTEARLDAYWRTINLGMRDVLKPQTAIDEYRQITKSISANVEHLKRLLLSTRIAHGKYFTHPETD